MTTIQNFNLRVYGLLIHEGQLLITHENRDGMEMVKLPGGGLEKGEGLADCLIREFKEELNVEITVGEFFYVNDFLQVSAFKSTDQLISFYYQVSVGPAALRAINHLTEEGPSGPEMQQFEWLDLDEIDPNEFTFPIDKLVAQKLRDELIN